MSIVLNKEERIQNLLKVNKGEGGFYDMANAIVELQDRVENILYRLDKDRSENGIIKGRTGAV